MKAAATAGRRLNVLYSRPLVLFSRSFLCFESLARRRWYLATNKQHILPLSSLSFPFFAAAGGRIRPLIIVCVLVLLFPLKLKMMEDDDEDGTSRQYQQAEALKMPKITRHSPVNAPSYSCFPPRQQDEKRPVHSDFRLAFLHAFVDETGVPKNRRHLVQQDDGRIIL